MKPQSLLPLASLVFLAGQMIASYGAELPEGFTPLGSLPLVAISSGEKLLAHWTSENANEIGLVEIETGTKRTGLQLPEPMELLHLHFAHGSGFIYAVSETGKVVIWKGREAPEIIQLEEVTEIAGKVIIDRQGTRLLHVGRSSVNYQTAAIWDIGSGKLIHSWKDSPFIGAAFSKDESRAMLATKNSISAYQFENEEESTVTEMDGSAYQLQVSPSGRYVCAIGDTRATVVDTVTLESDYVESSPGMKLHFGGEDEHLIVAHSTERNRRIEVWKLKDGISNLILEKEIGGRLADPIGVSKAGLVFHTRESEMALRLELFGEPEYRMVGYDSTMLREVAGDRNYAATITMLSINEEGTLVATGLAGKSLALWATNIPIYGFKTINQRNAPRVPETRYGDRCIGTFNFEAPVSSAKFLGKKGSILLTFVTGTQGLLFHPTAFPQTNIITKRYRSWERYASRELKDLDFSPQGDKLAVAVSPGVSILQVETGQELQFFPYSSFFSRFNSRGDNVLCIGQSQHGIGSLVTKNYISMRDFGQAGPPTPGARTATGITIANKHAVLDLDAGRQVRTFEGREVKRISRVAISQDGKTFALAGSVNRLGRPPTMQLEVFDVGTGELKVSMETEAKYISELFVLNDGYTVVLRTRDRVAVFDTRRRRALRVIPDEMYRDYGDDRTVEIRTFDEFRKSPGWLHEYIPIRGQQFFIEAMDLREAADRILIAEPSRVTIWRLSTGEQLWMGDMPGGEVSVAKLSPNGKVIAIGKKSGDVHLQRIP